MEGRLNYRSVAVDPGPCHPLELTGEEGPRDFHLDYRARQALRKAEHMFLAVGSSQDGLDL